MTQERRPILDDCDEYPLRGTHYHQLMQNVPASYLCEVWNQDPNSASPELLSVRQYIQRRLKALRREYPEGPWPAATKRHSAL